VTSQRFAVRAQIAVGAVVVAAGLLPIVRALAPARRSPKGEGSTRHLYTTGQGLWTSTSNCAAVDGANQA
jgi:hypothetical protein